MAGRAAAKSAKTTTVNCFRMKASVIQAHFERHISTRALPLLYQPSEESIGMLGFSLNLCPANETRSRPSRFRARNAASAGRFYFFPAVFGGEKIKSRINRIAPMVIAESATLKAGQR